MYDTRLRDLTCVKDVGEKIQTFFKVESDVTEHGIHAGLVVLALWSSTNCPMDWYRSPLTSWTNKRRGGGRGWPTSSQQVRLWYGWPPGGRDVGVVAESGRLLTALRFGVRQVPPERLPSQRCWSSLRCELNGGGGRQAKTKAAQQPKPK